MNIRFTHYFFKWTTIFPIITWIFYATHLVELHPLFAGVAAILLIASVLSAVQHSETIAHRVGEPFGTIILAMAITTIEVAIIVSFMLSNPETSITLARDTIYATIMIILNGLLGISILLGAIKYREQKFQNDAGNTALTALVTISVLTLILPNFTTTVPGPMYTPAQLIFVAIASLVVYGSFLLIQTVRHRDYFTVKMGYEVTHPDDYRVSIRDFWWSFALLVLSLIIVVLTAKSLSPIIEQSITNAGLPIALVGVVIAGVVLLPESLAAIQAARRNHLQTTINLGLGSALASIGLTIPTIALISVIFHMDIHLGVDTKSMVLLVLSLFMVMLSLAREKTNILYGVVLLVNLVDYIFMVINP